MAYNKKTWISDEVITKEALNNIENGIEAVEQSIPKKTSQLENDSGYLTEHQDLSSYVTLERYSELLTKVIELEERINTLSGIIHCTNISLSNSDYSFNAVNETMTLKAVLSPSNTTETAVFSSSNNDVATVTQFGLVTSRGEGTCIITVTCGGQTATCNISVDIPES